MGTFKMPGMNHDVNGLLGLTEYCWSENDAASR
jgi:hypothetical protein